MILHVQIIGSLLMFLAIIHVGFPKYFKWKIQLKSLSLINSQMMTTHTFFIALTVFLMGLLCVTSATELVETNFGKRISLGLSIFWFIRLIFQLFVYSSLLWKGKKFETIMHTLFTAFWIYISAIFCIIYFN